MKKFIPISLILCTILSLCVFALPQEHNLQYASAPINIDGKNTESDWANAAKISLTKDNTGTWANMTEEKNHLPLDAYFLWSDDGIYVFADITDNDVATNQNDCFEVALNPGGLIPDKDSLEGLFFTYWLDDGEVVIKRHNQLDGTQGGVEVEDKSLAKYTLSDHGYYIETLIKWEWLILSDRPVLTDNGEYKTGILDKFTVKNGEYINAIVCYLNGDSKHKYNCVYRTVTELDKAGNFSTATYDIKFTLTGKPEHAETTEPVKEDTTVEAQTNSIQTNALTTNSVSTEAPTEKQEVKASTWVILGIIALACIVGAMMFILNKKKITK